jgi:hypothetical protein
LAPRLPLLAIHGVLQSNRPAAIVLPLGRCDAIPERTATGFLTAVPLVARYGDEATLFRLAAQLEKARPWFDRKPLVASDSKST